MVETETFSLFIQMVALFLPAWAIMVQIFARLMEDSDLDENPSLIPLFGVGLSLAVVSVWLLGRAFISTVVSHMLDKVESGAADPLLFDGLLDILKAETSFMALGVIVLTIASIKYFEKWNGRHIAFIVILSFAAMNLVSEVGPAGVTWLMIFIMAFDWMFTKTAWPGVRDSLRDGDTPLQRKISD